MTTQEAIEILTEMRDWNDYITQSDALQMAIDELEKKPAASCEDAISRQAVMDGLEKYHEGADLHIDGLTYAYDLVCKLPSVSVTEKTGHWEKLSVGYGCSECSLCTNILGTIDFKYCPKCGAKMENMEELLK